MKNYYWQIIELLTAYIRVRRNIDKYWIDESKLSDCGEFDKIIKACEEPPPTNYNSKKVYFLVIPIEADIQAIITVLGRRNMNFHEEGHKINLRFTNLYGANFREDAITNEKTKYIFIDFSFVNSILYKCVFSGSNFIYSFFQEAYIKDSYLMEAYFENCIFNWSTFQKNNFSDINLSSSEFNSSYFSQDNTLTINELKTARCFRGNFFENQHLKEELEINYPDKIKSKNFT